jgi:hypothetical protein
MEILDRWGRRERVHDERSDREKWISSAKEGSR